MYARVQRRVSFFAQSLFYQHTVCFLLYRLLYAPRSRSFVQLGNEHRTSIYYVTLSPPPPFKTRPIPNARDLIRNICRGLFERHKLLFSALICFQILRHRAEIPRDEWALFLRGPGPVDRSSQPPNPNPARLTPVQWDLLFAAEQRAVGSGSAQGAGGGEGGEGEGGAEEDDGGDEVGGSPLEGLCESVTENWGKWVSWADKGDVWDESRIPGEFFKKGTEGRGATAFQRLLLVRAFREDQLLRCIAKFVGEKLGSSFAER